MTRKVVTKGVGKALEKEKRRQMDKARNDANRPAVVAENTGTRSVLDQGSLEELVATVEMKRNEYDELMGDAEESGPVLVPNVPRERAELQAAERRRLVPIPRRPAWREGMSADDVAAAESEAFIQWRRSLQAAAKEESLHLTPYEKNLDFWRQLWRCVERSDLILQIVDARDPDFFFCRDLLAYVAEVSQEKRLVLLVNKADFLPVPLRLAWKAYFQECGVEAYFFSALYELRQQQRLYVQQQRQLRLQGREQESQEEDSEEEEEEEVEEPKKGRTWKIDSDSESSEEEEEETTAAGSVKAAADVPVPDSDSELGEQDAGEGDDAEEEEEEDEEEKEDEEAAPLGAEISDEQGIHNSGELLEELAGRLKEQKGGTVGFVGYPNVGKSTVINALLGTKKVGMSSTPGKTKHIQTIEIPALGLTLCDCPGLVFPSVAASKAHLVINNTVPLDDLRECAAPVTLIVEKMGLKPILAFYGCFAAVKIAQQRTGCKALSETRSLLASLAISRNHLLRALVPDEDWAARKVLKDFVAGRLLHCELPPGMEKEEEEEEEDDEPLLEEDFGDVASFLSAKERKNQRVTKRGLRMAQKRQGRGKKLVGAEVEMW